MDCRLCENYKYGKFEGAYVPVHYCRYYSDALTEMIRGEENEHPKFELVLYRNGKVEVNGASNCEHYIDKDFHYDPKTRVLTYREIHWPKYITDRILPGMFGFFLLWVLYNLIKYFWNKIVGLF